MKKQDVEIGGKRRLFLYARDGDEILLFQPTKITAGEVPEVTYRSVTLAHRKKMVGWEMEMYTKLRDIRPTFGHFQGMLFGIRKDLAYLEKLERTFNTVGIV